MLYKQEIFHNINSGKVKFDQWSVTLESKMSSTTNLLKLQQEASVFKMVSFSFKNCSSTFYAFTFRFLSV